MLIVVDTNVFVGACLGQGAASAVIDGCLVGRYVPLMGAALLAEYEDVLGRARLLAQSKLSAAERDELLDIFLAACRWTPIYFGWRSSLADEGDNHLIELAVADHASHIVSRNLRDLRRAQLHFPNLRAVSPEQLLKEIEP